MMFPLSILDMGLLFSVTALILFIAVGLLSSDYQKVTILLNIKKLKNAAILFSVLFLGIVVLHIINNI